MCLLVVLFETHPDAPLVVAANRDELLARPALPLGVLDEGPPRVVGGRDLVGGGTWLALDARGLVCGLTNLPSARQAARRSRGELPLLALRRGDATAAAAALGALRASDFNPCWLFTADPRALFYVDLSGDGAPPRALPPGIHVLENRPLGAPSRKVERVRRLLDGIEAARGDALVEGLRRVLADHTLPDDAEPRRPRETEAACVHAGLYGTRSAEIVIATETAPPRVWVADGPACTAALVEVSALVANN